MRTSKFTLIIAGVLALAGNALGEDAVDYRLPPGISPDSQNVELRLDPAIAEFSGNTTIKLRVEQDAERIGLHQLRLDMTRIELSGGGAKRSLTATEDDWDINWLADGETISAGDYELYIEFNGSYDTDSLGMHRAHFEDNDYVFTQFESMYARRAFPVFDEPEFKIPYQLTINAPAGLTVVSNTPEAGRSESGGWQRVEFMQTKPLPSYLIAYSVGPLDRAEIEGMSVPGYIYTPKGRSGDLGFVLRETATIVAALEEYFGFDYPYKKLDFLAVPEFAFGAMENPGLITFRTDLLLLGDEVSGSTAETALMVIAHEVAHIWYGDLVTMKWWNDLWLNEAFATWMAMSTMARTYPEYETGLKLPQAAAFPVDQRTTAKAIRKPARNEEEIMDGLGLNYSKGHSILNMLEAYVGHDAFRTAIQAYLKKYAWSNASETDLWEIISETSGLDVSAIASDFLNQPGFAALTIADDGTVTQKRYLTYGREAGDLQWQMPLNVKYKKDGEVRNTFYLLNDESGTIDLPAGADWVFPDAGGNGYYRWSVDSALFYNLVDDADELTAREKIALLGNSEALLNSGDLSLADYLFVLNRMLADPHPLVFLPALENLKVIGDEFIDDSNGDLFARFVDQALSERFGRVGVVTRESDSESTIQMRPRLMRVLGQYGSDPSVQSAARAIAVDYLDAPETLSGDLGREALRVSSLQDDGSLYAAYKSAYLHSTSEDLKSNILASIYFRNPEIVLSHLDFSLSADVPAGDSRSAFFYFSTILQDHALLYDWLDENMDAYLAKMPSIYHPTFPQLFQNACNELTLGQLKEFFGDRGDIFGPSLAKATETMENCISRKDRESDALAEFLAQYSE
jgi:alanyl aminopeptidase